MSRYCPVCKRVLDLDRFYQKSRGYCKECHREYNRQRRKDAGRMRKATARKRFYRQLERIRDNPNLTEAERREERLIAVEDAMRVRWSWFDDLMRAEESASRGGLGKRCKCRQNRCLGPAPKRRNADVEK